MTSYEPTCGDCRHLLEGCCDFGICELEFEEAFEEQQARERLAVDRREDSNGRCR